MEKNMADEEDHVDVNIEDAPKTEEKVKDELEVEVVDVKKADEEKTPVIEPQEGINELKKKLENEKRAREDAERRAHEARQVAEKAKFETKDANYNMVVNAIETVKGRGEALKTAYAEAMNVGDFTKAAEIQEAVAVNSSQLADLKRGEKAMKEQLEEAKEAAKVRPVDPPRGDAIEQIASQVSQRSADWIRANREILPDERAIRRMFRAHEDAIDEGVAPDSDDYFRFIEGRLGKRQEPVRPPEAPLSEAAAPKKSVPPPAAPVTRSTPRQGVVRLTREQADTARMLGMTEAEYAKNMVALQREGKIGH
jgi:hypothetical protein